MCVPFELKFALHADLQPACMSGLSEDMKYLEPQMKIMFE